jgi:hypothetical protein
MGADDIDFSFHPSDFDSDDDLNVATDEKSDIEDDGTNDVADAEEQEVASIVLNEEVKFYEPDDNAYTSFAQKLLEQSMEAMVITTDEESIIQNSSVNSGKYEKQKTSVEDRFFQTIKDYGGLAMSDLLIFVRHGLTIDRKFYFLVRGDRDETKRVIISKCLLLCALKWRNL